jgi:hypothetical protein
LAGEGGTTRLKNGRDKSGILISCVDSRVGGHDRALASQDGRGFALHFGGDKQDTRGPVGVCFRAFSEVAMGTLSMDCVILLVNFGIIIFELRGM